MHRSEPSMTDYVPPLRDLRFALNNIADVGALAHLDAFQAATPDTLDAVLAEAGKLAAGVVGPLNAVGDREGSRLENGVVRTPTGFKDAYRTFVDGGWMGLSVPEADGGQGLPFTLGLAVMEMITSANMAFSLCPMLTASAIEGLRGHGSGELKAKFLAKLVSGEWPGTMELTEPQAGSDVGAVRTHAEPQPDGSFRLTGTKIFISWGDHDLAENIIHLVLARTPGSPPGTKGLSLFLVPKYLVNADGSPGSANDIRCVSLEHKLGLHASPTAVLAYGDNEGAAGWLVGDEGAGIRCMFTIMNHARIMVGLQGVAIGERALGRALAYARERRQGATSATAPGEKAFIIEHADVRRMLMTMKATVEAMRGLVLLAGEAQDLARHGATEEDRRRNQGLVDLLTPVAKAWCTDRGVDVADLGIQVHGGSGYIEETGAAQHLRDIRIATIWEGTNGIQAIDLVGRKLTLDGGRALADFLVRLRGLDADLAGDDTDGGDFAAIRAALGEGIAALSAASDWMVEALARDADAALAGATPYLRMFGTVTGGYALARGAVAARASLANGGAEDGDFLRAKIATARFYAEQIMPQAAALLGPVTRGADLLFAIDPQVLSA
jgi:alkylation response protein AidB-like acyl-CoA dehydrogenase